MQTLDFNFRTFKACLGIEVVSASCDNSRLIHRDDGSVRVSHQLGVEVKRPGVASSIGYRSRSSVGCRSKGRSSVGGRSHSGSSVGSRSSDDSLSSEMLSSGSGNAGLVNRHHGTVGVSDQPVKWSCRGSGETAEDNLQRRESLVTPVRPGEKLPRTSCLRCWSLF